MRFIVVVIVILLVLGYMRNRRANLTSTTRMAEVTTGDISKTVAGSGTLSAADIQEITLDAGLKIETVDVEAGDTVLKGQKLAALDKESVDDQVTTLRSDIATIDAMLARLNGKTVSSSIRATVGGRIKAIFVDKGDDVANAMAQNGALMILSTDGKMQVAFTSKADGLKVGSDVAVMLPDGKSEEGAVESLVANQCVVTLTDDGPALNDAVKIMSADNKTQYGEGTLAVNKPLSVIASGGTVKKINKKLNDKVSRNSTLITIDNEPYLNDYETQYNLRTQKVAELQTMLLYQANPAVIAPCNGIVKELFCKDQETISADKTAFSIATGGVTKLVVTIDELDLNYVAVGQKAAVTLDAIAGQTFDGEITQVSEMGNALNGVTTFNVTLALQPDAQLKAGMNATATITVGTHQNVLLPAN